VKPIKDFPGYFINEKAEVFTTWKRGISTRNSKGQIIQSGKRTLGNQLINLAICKRRKDQEYVFVVLYKDGKRFYKSIHHLMLESFDFPRPKGAVCRHLNNNAGDNRLENLKWGTQKENIHDKKLHGTWQSKEKHPMVKMNSKKIKLIRILHQDFHWKPTKIWEVFGGIYNMSFSGIYHNLKYNWKD
jgi:hypothetical protein